MIFKLSDFKKTFLYFVQGPKFYGGGAPSGQSSTVTNQATIPDELKPYISTYMGAAEKQLYQKNAEGEVTGFQPYKAYGATFDAQGNQTAYDPSKGIAGFDPMQVQGYNAAKGLSTGNTFGTATGMATGAGQGMMGSAGTALGYGAQGQAIGQQGAANAANQAGSQIGQAGGYGAQGAGIGMAAAGQAGQGYNAQGNFANQITNPGTTAAYMSPYMQNVVNQQIGAANRQYDITGSQEMANASRANAFGGSREALMAAENERARNTAIGDIQAKGLQSAFTEAQNQQQFGANLGIQGLNAGTNAMQAGIQGAQTGIQGVGAQTAASNMQLAGNAQALQGNAQALEGVRTAQAGYTGADQAAGTLGNLGTQDLAAQQSIIKTQEDLGAQARARDQAIKDQAMLDYANAHNKPMQDISTMSNLVRGTPLNSSTTTTYSANPSGLSTALGAAATGIGAYGALKANGGVIEDKGYANGGIVGYATGGSVEGSMRSKLEDLDTSHLQAIIKENESPEMTKLAKEVLATNYAKGGIVAFAQGGQPAPYESSIETGKELSTKVKKQSKERMAYEAEMAARDATPVTESAPSSSDSWAERSNTDVRGQLKKGYGTLKSGIASLVTPENIAAAGSEINAQRFKEGLGSESTLSSVEQGVLGGASLAPELVKHLIENGTGGSMGEQFRKTDRFGLATALDKFGDSASKRYEIIKNWANTPVVGGNKGIADIETPNLVEPKKIEPMGAPAPMGQMQNETQTQTQTIRPSVSAQEGRNATSVMNQGAPAQANTPTQSEDSVLSRLQASKDSAQKEADMSVEERIQHQKDLEEKFAGKDTETAAYRKSIMDERANAPDEARRQMSMRLMEFGANWASTPGAPLVAGMKALTSTLPSIMEDTKANKKMMKDLDKSEYLLNHATRLEELGHLKEASAAKDNASELVMKHEEKLVTYGLAQQKIQSEEKIARLAQFGATTRAGMEQEGRSDPRAITGSAALQSYDRQLAAYDKKQSDGGKNFKFSQEQLNDIEDLQRKRKVALGRETQYQAPEPTNAEAVRARGDKTPYSFENMTGRKP